MMTASLADLEARLGAMEHVNAIKELQSRYWRGVDRQALDAVRDCFVETGVVIDMEGVPACSDRDEFIKVLTISGGKPGFYSLHTGNNAIITLIGADTAAGISGAGISGATIPGPGSSGDQIAADGIWDAFFIGIDVGARLTYQLSGEYNNHYVLRNGEWLIQTQRFRQTSLLVQKISEDGSPTVVTFGRPDAGVFGE